MLYRTKPMMKEAFRLSTKKEDRPGWFREGPNAQFVRNGSGDVRLRLRMADGNVIYADMGDWIIKGIKGEIYPCKHDVFEATYELVCE
jgi:hypothetical protein